ncbi:elongation factor P maturation arginine rhamnosyltransferase EarP [Variovorax sp. LT1R16]|uniref:elongation factor P maturation arginine rhamnosyltransferase EarP n=1 Tax=Variovorax sp. LT1R16 TaxID=3443728 RepID=UPI003F46F976
MRWDIFCRVIDNHGDLGVCWRLARQLAARGESARLWVDDGRALAWMAPGGCAGVEVVDWSNADAVEAAAKDAPPDVLVEGFGCEPAPALIARHAEHARAPGFRGAWINLEYLSAEPYVERLHTLPSSVFRGPGEGLTKRFFYPGFSVRTGGLLREPDLAARQLAFDRAAWLASQRIGWQPGERLVSLFCYEPAQLAALLGQWASGDAPVRLLVTAGRAAQAVRAALGLAADATAATSGRLSIHFLPLLTQDGFDALLWSCDLNFVRGEDSLVRALWAGRPFAWQIYPQDDDAHHVKLDALLDAIEAPSSLRAFHHAWNDTIDDLPVAPDTATLASWGAATVHARDALHAQDDLLTQLMRFVDALPRN